VYPESFYTNFPTVTLTPPFSEHYARDFGGATLGIAVVLGIALAAPRAAFTIPAAVAFSTFAVPHFFLASGWDSGFVANISITNTGPNPITGWTLAFSFPVGTESVSSSYWNANFSRGGQHVVVTPIDWNAYLAPRRHRRAAGWSVGGHPVGR
jgi:hypothetical protein